MSLINYNNDFLKEKYICRIFIEICSSLGRADALVHTAHDFKIN